MALTITPQVTSLTGTANRVSVSAANGAVTLSGPQDLHTGASPQFLGLSVTNAISGSITGNAATVTNGVYTSGSYSDPSWLTLSASKVGLGNVTNESKATMFSSPSFTGNITLTGLTTGTTAGTLTTTTAPTATTSTLGWNGYFYATKVYNAVWNDIADFIEVDEDTEIEFGRLYYRQADYKIATTKKYGQRAIGIASDTYGFGIGQKDGKKQIPIAIGGWVLAFTDKIYKPGTPLVANKYGELSKANLFMRMFHSDRIIAHFDREEKEAIWNNVIVNTRNWVKVRG